MEEELVTKKSRVWIYRLIGWALLAIIILAIGWVILATNSSAKKSTTTQPVKIEQPRQ